MVSSPYIIDEINVIIATLAAFITFDADPQLSGMVNKCHPYLKLFTISDLLTYDGSCIHPDLEKRCRISSWLRKIKWAELKNQLKLTYQLFGKGFKAYTSLKKLPLQIQPFHTLSIIARIFTSKIRWWIHYLYTQKMTTQPTEQNLSQYWKN